MGVGADLDIQTGKVLSLHNNIRECSSQGEAEFKRLTELEEGGVEVPKFFMKCMEILAPKQGV